MDICTDCNTTLVFRLVLKDSKTKKLYICPNCGKYSFIDYEE